MLRLSTLVLFLSLFINHSTFSQILKNDSTIFLKPIWVKGELANFTYRQSRERYVNGSLVQYDAYLSSISMQVVKANKSSQTIVWTYNSIDPEIPNASPISNDLASLTKGLAIKYSIYADGTFKSLNNWKKIRKYIYKSLEELSSKYNSAAVDSMLLESKKLYEFKENIEQLVISDIQLMHTLYGSEYILNKKEKVITAYPYEEDKEIPAVLTYELTSLDKKKKLAKIILRQFVDTESKFVKDNFMNIPLIRDYNEFEIDTKKGWVNKAQFIRESKIGNTRSVDNYELKRL